MFPTSRLKDCSRFIHRSCHSPAVGDVYIRKGDKRQGASATREFAQYDPLLYSVTATDIRSATKLPDGSTASLRSSELDAYRVFEDLCLLANQEQPGFLRLESLPKTFALELIESVLTNYHVLFHKVGLFTRSLPNSMLTCHVAKRDIASPTPPSQSIIDQIIIRETNFSAHAAVYKSRVHPLEAFFG